MSAVAAKRLRLALTTAAALVAGLASLPAVANADADAAKFNIEAYSTCTATTTPAPDQDYDGVVTTCCVQSAGVPTPTKYGMACVAPAAENQAADFRPTIVLPFRPRVADDAGLLEGEQDDATNPPLPDGPNIVGSPFDDGGLP